MCIHPIPLGLCQCGCGEQTRISTKTNSREGQQKGRPLRFLPGHHSRVIRRTKRIKKKTKPAFRVHTIRPGGNRWTVQNRGYKTPCWIWTGAAVPLGYGTLHADGRYYRAHRFFYEKARGPIPDGLHLDHLCRVPACVNPDHLEPVTSAENTRRGAGARLTADAVRFIRSQPRSVTPTEIAAQLGVAPCTVTNVRAGRSWKEVAPVHPDFATTTPLAGGSHRSLLGCPRQDREGRRS